MEPEITNHSQPWKHKICAVVITFNPDEKLISLLYELGKQVDHVILIDNASSNANLEHIEKARQFQDLTLFENSENLGVAAALNQGFEKADLLGYEWVITFDQDSMPAGDMVQRLWMLQEPHERSSDIAIVAPNILDIGSGRSSSFLQRRTQFLYERVMCGQSALKDITTVITTGAMLRMDAFKAAGGFREDLFIDYVDTDFCLRLLQHGYRIWVACDAVLHHTFGSRRKIKKGPIVLFPTFHSPERWYTISRNRIQMIKSYGFRFPHWLFYETVATCFILFRMVLTEDQKIPKISALIKGTWDGFRGKLGKPPWANKDTE